MWIRLTLGVGVDVAFFVSAGVEMNGIAFVDFDGLLKAGHATQRQCSAEVESTPRPHRT
jgi:hypothetical protein